jgi:hypothetical protein
MSIVLKDLVFVTSFTALVVGMGLAIVAYVRGIARLACSLWFMGSAACTLDVSLFIIRRTGVVLDTQSSPQSGPILGVLEEYSVHINLIGNVLLLTAGILLLISLKRLQRSLLLRTEK